MKHIPISVSSVRPRPQSCPRCRQVVDSVVFGIKRIKYWISIEAENERLWWANSTDNTLEVLNVVPIVGSYCSILTLH